MSFTPDNKNLIASYGGKFYSIPISGEDAINIPFKVKEDYENPDENPQVMADYLAKELDMDVKLYPITSEGSIIEALRFGNAHIAFMDGAACLLYTSPSPRDS